MRISDWSSDVCSSDLASGRWDDAERVVAELPEEGRIASDPVQASTMLDLAEITLRRGDPERVRELASAIASRKETSYVQARSGARRAGKACVSTCTSTRSPDH